METKKINTELLNREFLSERRNGCAGVNHNFYNIDFHLKNNEIIYNAVNTGFYGRSNYAHTKEIYEKPETISEALNRLKIKIEDIKYIKIKQDYIYNWPDRPVEKWEAEYIYEP